MAAVSKALARKAAAWAASASAAELVDRALEHADVGVGAMVMFANEVVFSHCRGFADIERRIAFAPNTVIDLASVSKHFTAVAVLLCELDGALSLDDAVDEFVPELAPLFTDTGAPSVRQLLHHTGGLPNYLDLEVFAEDTEGAFWWWDVERIVGELGATTTLVMEFAPGERYSYSNSGYLVLALVVERASEMRFAEFMRARVFEPLGMSSSGLLSEPKAASESARDYLARAFGGAPCALGYSVQDGRVAPSSSLSLCKGDGGVFTTLDDLVLWEVALQRDLSDLGLSRSAMELMFTSGATSDGTAVGYGLGWNVVDEQLPMVFHAGSWTGSSTVYSHNTEHDESSALAIVVVCNGGEMNDKINALSDALYELFCAG